MISTVLRRSLLNASRRTRILSASLTSINAVLFHHLTPASTSTTVTDVASNVHSDVKPSFTLPQKNSNPFGVKVRDFHVNSIPSEFRASMVSTAGFAAQDYAAAYESSDGDWEESVGSNSSRDGGDEELAISELGISLEIFKALKGRGIEKLFPIQKAVLDPAMEGRDMIARARTGTGKTLAFGIPIMDKIVKFNAKHGRGKNPRCLVLAPTRELARQVEKEFKESAPSLDTICLYGNTSIGQQMKELNYGIDVAVGTPSRVIDLMQRGALNVSEVQFVVLDEADQMLQVGFVEDVDVILGKLPEKRQSLMFSATMPSEIRSLTKKHLNNPLTIDLVGDSNQKLAEGITMYSITADSNERASIIAPLIAEHSNGGKCVVFTKTKGDADRLSRSLKCKALHGDISEAERDRTVASFREGNLDILVATDVAARGLDVPNLNLVIHYEPPDNTETFVQRTGRTGRAGKKGNAILIHSPEQSGAVKMIENEVGSKFTELPSIAVESRSGSMFEGMGSPGSSFGGRSGGSNGRSGGSSNCDSDRSTQSSGRSSFGGFGSNDAKRSYPGLGDASRD